MKRKITLCLLVTVALLILPLYVQDGVKHLKAQTHHDVGMPYAGENARDNGIAPDNSTAPDNGTAPNSNIAQNGNEAQSSSAAQSDGTASDVIGNGKSFGDIVKEKGIKEFDGRLEIVIDKSDHTLSLVYDGMLQKSYHVEFGDGGGGDKEIAGDHKTPEGTFYVSDKSTIDPPDYYLGSRWLGVSYPNIEDAERGLEDGLIDRQTYGRIAAALGSRDVPPADTPLGGDIGIHGGGTPEFGADWTWGCIGLSNKDIEDFYGFIPVGTPIVIRK